MKIKNICIINQWSIEVRNRPGINVDMIISAMCEYATCQKLAGFYNLSSTAF